MKNIILCVLVLFMFSIDTQAQTDNNGQTDETYSQWQVRARGVYISPAPYFFRNVDGIEVEISETVAPEIGATYYFSRKISADFSISTSTHDVQVEGGSNLGSISLISPTLTLQHHFYLNKFKPYLGLGFNYTAFYDEDPGDLDAIEYKNQVGYVLQAGIDYSISDKWFINLDFRKMYLKTEVTGNNDSSTTSEVNVDPIILGFGVGYKF